VVLGTMVGLFLTTTSTIVLCVIDNYDGWYKRRELPGTEAYFADNKNGVRVSKDLLLLASALLGDGLICWRLFVIWSRNVYVLIAPVIILVAEGVIGLLVVGFDYHSIGQPEHKFQDVLNVGSIVVVACSVVVNILVTSLIAGRLWWMGRQIQDISDRQAYTRIIVVLIESGSLYTATILVFFVFVVARMEGAYRLIDYIVTICVAIAPTLIVFRLNYVSQAPLDVEFMSNIAQSPSTPIHFNSPIDETESLDLDPETIVSSPRGRLTSQATLASSIPGPKHHPPRLQTSFQVKFQDASNSSLATHSPVAGSRLRTSSSQPSFPIGLGWSDISLSSGTREALGVPGGLQSPSLHEIVSPAHRVGQPAVEEFLPPLPSPLPSPTVNPRPSMTFSLRQGRPSTSTRDDTYEMRRIE